MTVSDYPDRGGAARRQYGNASRLKARIEFYSRFSSNKQSWHEWIFDHYALPPECRILELGCGAGATWWANLDRIPDGWQIVLSDFSEGMVQEARESLAGKAKQFSFEVIDAQNILFENESFDVAIANHMLYHVVDMDKALSEIHRVLRPRGRLFASTIGRKHLWELLVLIRQCDPDATTWVGQMSDRYVLENGHEVLSRLFTDVKLYRYENVLEVTELGPLQAYMESQVKRPTEGNESFAKVVELIKQKLSQGPMRISDWSGLFEACGKRDLENE